MKAAGVRSSSLGLKIEQVMSSERCINDLRLNPSLGIAYQIQSCVPLQGYETGILQTENVSCDAERDRCTEVCQVSRNINASSDGEECRIEYTPCTVDVTTRYAISVPADCLIDPEYEAKAGPYNQNLQHLQMLAVEKVGTENCSENAHNVDCSSTRLPAGFYHHNTKQRSSLENSKCLPANRFLVSCHTEQNMLNTMCVHPNTKPTEHSLPFTLRNGQTSIYSGPELVTSVGTLSEPYNEWPLVYSDQSSIDGIRASLEINMTQNGSILGRNASLGSIKFPIGNDCPDNESENTETNDDENVMEDSSTCLAMCMHTENDSPAWFLNERRQSDSHRNSLDDFSTCSDTQDMLNKSDLLKLSVNFNSSKSDVSSDENFMSDVSILQDKKLQATGSRDFLIDIELNGNSFSNSSGRSITSDYSVNITNESFKKDYIKDSLDDVSTCSNSTAIFIDSDFHPSNISTISIDSDSSVKFQNLSSEDDSNDNSSDEISTCSDTSITSNWHKPLLPSPNRSDHHDTNYNLIPLDLPTFISLDNDQLYSSTDLEVQAILSHFQSDDEESSEDESSIDGSDLFSNESRSQTTTPYYDYYADDEESGNEDLLDAEQENQRSEKSGNSRKRGNTQSGQDFLRKRFRKSYYA